MNVIRSIQFHRLRLLLLLSALSTVVGFDLRAAGLTPTRLRCEYEVNPLGIDDARPRLFWQLEGSARGQTQTAYQILVASAEAELRRGVGDLWDSGKVDSGQSVFVPYGGKELGSLQPCYWRVRVWDKDGKRSAWSAPAMWTMGILREEDWQGQWIASDLELKGYQKTLRDLPDFGMEPESEISGMADKCRQMSATAKEAPAVWLRKEFEAPGRIRRATASICGLGFYELYLNGARVATTTWTRPTRIIRSARST